MTSHTTSSQANVWVFSLLIPIFLIYFVSLIDRINGIYSDCIYIFIIFHMVDYPFCVIFLSDSI